MSGGAVGLQPGWFPGHSSAFFYINLGDGNVPINYSLPMVPVFQILGPTNQLYNGSICLPQVPLPVNYTAVVGHNATIQVIETAQHGASLYSVRLFSMILVFFEAYDSSVRRYHLCRPARCPRGQRDQLREYDQHRLRSRLHYDQPVKRRTIGRQRIIVTAFDTASRSPGLGSHVTTLVSKFSRIALHLYIYILHFFYITTTRAEDSDPRWCTLDNTFLLTDDARRALTPWRGKVVGGGGGG